MDPCWKFPLQELGELFRSLTLIESMLISLEHIQVHFVTVHKTRLHKFRKNVISFPQESATLFGRKGALRQYRVGERVNSSRGPLLEGEDVERPPKLEKDATADQQQHKVQGRMHLVFAADIIEIANDGRLRLQYDCDSSTAWESPEWVEPRVQMPWHPELLRENLVLMFRRNLGHGRVIDGLEVRWEKVVRVMRALTRIGRWRDDEVEGPMHKWYDPKLFDVELSEQEVRWKYAPKVWRGELVTNERAEELRNSGNTVEAVDVRTPAELQAAGFTVRIADGGSLFDDTTGEQDASLESEVDLDVFRRWIELSEMPYGDALGRWYVGLSAEGEDLEPNKWKAEDDDTPCDLYGRILGFYKDKAKEAHDRFAAIELPKHEWDLRETWDNQRLDAETRHALGCDGKLSVRGLVLWCRTHKDLPMFLNDALSFEEHCEQVHTELCVTAEQFPT